MKMLGAKKFALKPKFMGHKYEVVNNSKGVSGRGLPRSDKSGKNTGESVTSAYPPLPKKKKDTNVNIHALLLILKLMLVRTIFVVVK